MMKNYGNPKSRNKSMNANKEKPNKVDVGMNTAAKKTTKPAMSGKSAMKSPTGFQGGTVSHEV